MNQTRFLPFALVAIVPFFAHAADWEVPPPVDFFTLPYFTDRVRVGAEATQLMTDVQAVVQSCSQEVVSSLYSDMARKAPVYVSGFSEILPEFYSHRRGVTHLVRSFSLARETNKSGEVGPTEMKLSLNLEENHTWVFVEDGSKRSAEDGTSPLYTYLSTELRQDVPQGIGAVYFSIKVIKGATERDEFGNVVELEPAQTQILGVKFIAKAEPSAHRNLVNKEFVTRFFINEVSYNECVVKGLDALN